MDPLNENLHTFLNTVVNATRGAAGYLFANPRGPIVKALEAKGLIEGDGKLTDPSDVNKVAYKATAKGEEYFPLPKAEPAPAAAVNGTGGDGVPAAADSTAPAAAAAKPARKPRGPVVQHDVKPVVSSVMIAKLPTTTLAAARGGRTEKYQFSQLKAPELAPDGVTITGYHSLFIPAVKGLENPAKQLASNVTKANKKDWPGKRTFAIYPIQVDEIEGIAGARIFRLK